jgi:hypothetical protein
MFPIYNLEGRAPRTSECLGINTFREVGSMKSLRLLALALSAFACTATVAQACDAHKSAKTATAGSTTTASAVVASVNGQAPTVAAEGGCSAHAMSATSATAASSTGKSAAGCSAAAAAQCTPAMKAACEKNAAVAAAMGCSGASGASAVTASNSGSSKATGCGSHSSSATAGMDHCGMKSAAASMAVAGLRCTEHQNGVAHDCSACEDWMQIDKDARAIGARSQVVALKNGAMIVYTADTPAQVKQLQAMVAKRNERMTAAYAGASDTKLCDDCKQLRGAIASGKLNREVVNVERGVMALVTSNDRAVVQRIRNMTGQPIAMR